MCDERLQSARQGHRKNPEAMSGCTPVAALRAKSEAPDRRKVVLLIAMSEVATFRWQPLRCDERSRGGRPVRDWQMGCGAESEERCGSLVGDSTTTCPADLTGDYYSEGSPSRFGKPAAIRLTILSQTDPPADDLRRHSLENRVRPRAFYVHPNGDCGAISCSTRIKGVREGPPGRSVGARRQSNRAGKDAAAEAFR